MDTLDSSRPAAPPADTPAAALTFDCPRCGRAASDLTYGPCGECRDELRTTQRRDAEQLDVDRYEPKLNVVPNHVATKE